MDDRLLARGGGVEVNRAMPERRHSFFQDQQLFLNFLSDVQPSIIRSR